MKNIILTLACSLLLLGCDRQSQPTVKTESVGIPYGATVEDALHQLQQIHATVLTNTPELVRAEFKKPDMPKPVQVELIFQAGKLDRVTYIP